MLKYWYRMIFERVANQVSGCD